MDENKEKTAKKSGLKNLLKSRKAKHGSLAIAVTAVAVAAVIILNIVVSLLVDRFPDLKADFTANNAFALNDDTSAFMGQLKKDVKLYILAAREDFEKTSTYFVQAKNLLDKMVSRSNGKFSVEYVDTAANPTFAQKYPNIDWTTKMTVGIVECGKQYKGLSVDECFTYDEEYYNYYGQYQFTGTTIEQAVVKGALYVTSDDRVIVDVLTGEGESGYEGITSLLTDNAYQVNEVSLITGKLDKDAEIALIYAPQTDLSDNALEQLRSWLDNDGKYGKTFIYVPNADPRLGEQKTPNIAALLKEWGMEINSGSFVYETNSDYLVNTMPMYGYLLDYTDYYKDGLKNANIPAASYYAHGITITDAQTAHALLNTSSSAGNYPLGADDNFDVKEHVTGEPIAIAAEGTKAGAEEYSHVIVFSSSMMLSQTFMSYYSFNNSAYFMNMVNTISEKEDDTIVIESKSLENSELGITDETTSNVMRVIFVFVIPVIVLALGIIVWIRRRNK